MAETAHAQPDAAAQPARPEHVAIIMDGNGRWARSRGATRSDGHRAGTGNLRTLIETFSRNGVRYLTLYAFSTENWRRPSAEVRTLIDLLREVIVRELRDLHENGVRILHLGRLDRLSPELQELVRQSLELTRYNTGLTLSVAFDYGGRDEIVNAVRGIVADGVPLEDVSHDLFARYLHTRDMPDPDLIVRTAGEMRLSNFLLWQSAYAEFYTTPVLWPDFGEREALDALAAYGRRQRRFGRAPGGP